MSKSTINGFRSSGAVKWSNIHCGRSYIWWASCHCRAWGSTSLALTTEELSQVTQQTASERYKGSGQLFDSSVLSKDKENLWDWSSKRNSKTLDNGHSSTLVVSLAVAVSDRLSCIDHHVCTPSVFWCLYTFIDARPTKEERQRVRDAFEALY